jgi:hypothetical protein
MLYSGLMAKYARAVGTQVSAKKANGLMIELVLKWLWPEGLSFDNMVMHPVCWANCLISIIPFKRGLMFLARKMGAMGGWRLAVGGWRLAVGGWRLAVGGRRSAVGGRRSAVGGGRLAVGGWRLAVAVAVAVAGSIPAV